MKKWAYLITTCCLLVTASGGANAFCFLEDLNGAWRFYAWAGIDRTFTRKLWTKCTIEVVGGTGLVEPDRVCENNDGIPFLTTGGELFINSACRVSGFVDTELGRIRIIHSFLESDDKTVWTGIATEVFRGADATFTAVKGVPIER